MSYEEALHHPLCSSAIQGQVLSNRQASDKISAWHNAHAAGGLVVYIPAGSEVKAPIRIDLQMSELTRADHLLVIADSLSSVTIVESLSSLSADPNMPSFRSAAVDIVAKEGASVTHIAVQRFGDAVVDFTRKRAWVDTNATVRWIDCHFGGSFIHSRATTRLQGEGASGTHRSTFFGVGQQQFDLYAEALHLAPHTSSDMASRGALTDRAKTIVRGLLRIENGATGSQGFQKEDALLLSHEAEIDAVPMLEIETDDVKCGHSAATGRINREKLFYVMSRGLDEPSAIKMLVAGFFSPLIDEMKASGLDEVVRCLIDDRLNDDVVTAV